MESLRGHLLVAGPDLVDPNFRRTVVLIGEHNDDGALGVVLNRPAPVTIGEVVPALVSLVPEDDRLFIGGPVQPQGVVILADLIQPDQAGMLVFGTIGFLLGDVEEEVAEAVRRARVFAGYTGWGAGQLETELEVSSWIVEPAVSGDVFTDRPEKLWSSVLRRKGGDFAMLATMPLDPSMN